MPRTPRPGKKVLYVEVPEELYAWFEARAAANYRTLKGEVMAALERYRANPDTVGPAQPAAPPAGPGAGGAVEATRPAEQGKPPGGEADPAATPRPKRRKGQPPTERPAAHPTT